MICKVEMQYLGFGSSQNVNINNEYICHIDSRHSGLECQNLNEKCIRFDVITKVKSKNELFSQRKKTETYYTI